MGRKRVCLIEASLHRSQESFPSEYPKLGTQFWAKYHGTPERYLLFSRAVNAIIQEKLAHPLAEELDRVTKLAEALIRETEETV
jgi:hypothetical protein